MIKTINAFDSETFDKLVNDFEALQGGRVFATQTHVTYSESTNQTMFTAVIFYRPSGSVLK